ncbi:agmatine deiminase [Tistrella bauzanensis]|uniref:Putative agmatine deiminase n=1 Tax=Tistrella arctica TaxID=3133430 RepID=A0ABU9YDS0_9PROT
MTAQDMPSPAAAGCRMPGEFGPHDGCWLIWPERPDNWRLGAKPAQAAFTAVATAIAAVEPVTVAASAGQWANARARLPGHVRVVEMTTNDAWVRDTGPSFVIDDRGGRMAVDWRFNAWGGLIDGLYFPWDRDDQVAAKIAGIEASAVWRAPIVMEGGAVHVDGEGTAFVTAECLLSPGRNAALGRDATETALKAALGVDLVIWLPRGVHLDETTGHVDNLLHVPAPGVICLTWTDDMADPQRAVSEEAEAMLAEARDARGRRLAIHRIHQPGPLTITADEAAGVDIVAGSQPRRAGDRMAGSYCNFYMANGGANGAGRRRIVMPLLDHARDQAAADAIAAACPGWEVVGVPGREILLGGGNIHCITQQVPARRRPGAA